MRGPERLTPSDEADLRRRELPIRYRWVKVSAAGITAIAVVDADARPDVAELPHLRPVDNSATWRTRWAYLSGRGGQLRFAVLDLDLHYPAKCSFALWFDLDRDRTFLDALVIGGYLKIEVCDSDAGARGPDTGICCPLSVEGLAALLYARDHWRSPGAGPGEAV